MALPTEILDKIALFLQEDAIDALKGHISWSVYTKKKEEFTEKRFAEIAGVLFGIVLETQGGYVIRDGEIIRFVTDDFKTHLPYSLAILESLTETLHAKFMKKRIAKEYAVMAKHLLYRTLKVDKGCIVRSGKNIVIAIDCWPWTIPYVYV